MTAPIGLWNADLTPRTRASSLHNFQSTTMLDNAEVDLLAGMVARRVLGDREVYA